MITGVSKDRNGKEYVSMMEHRRFPLLATTFMTERTQFERHGPNVFLPRDERTIEFSFNFMMSVINPLRNPAKRIDRLYGVVRAYFANYYMAERAAWDELEQVYLFNRIEMDKNVPMTFNEQLKSKSHHSHDSNVESLNTQHVQHNAAENDHMHTEIFEEIRKPASPSKNVDSDLLTSENLEKVYNVLVVMCVLLSLNIIVIGLYMKKIDLFAFIRSKVFNKNSTEYEELLK